MSNSDTQKKYRWQTPADRKIDIRLLVKISKLEKQDEGFFGLKKSPSLPDYQPNAHVLTGTIIDGQEKPTNQEFTLILPKSELGNISVNDYVAIGVKNNNVCFCIEKVPNFESKSEQMAWLANWQCSKP